MRTYFETRDTLTLADAIPIAQGQWTREQDGAKAATAAGQPLICDTDLVSSLVYTAQYYRDQVGTALWQRWQAWARAQLAILQRPPCSPGSICSAARTGHGLTMANATRLMRAILFISFSRLNSHPWASDMFPLKARLMPVLRRCAGFLVTGRFLDDWPDCIA